MGLGAATAGLFFAGRRQLKFTHTKIVTTQRPRLIVRHVLLGADVSPIDTVILLGHDADCHGGLSVVNVGGSDAKIVRALYRIYFSRGQLSARSPLEERPSVLLDKGTIIKAAKSKIVNIWGKVDLGPSYDNSPRDIRQFENEGWRIYVMGEICYTTMVVRTTTWGSPGEEETEQRQVPARLESRLRI